MKERLDILVVNNGLAPSREQARLMIMEGSIFVNGQREDKPGSTFEQDVSLTFHGKKLRYVSRGGLKLEKALEVFPIDPKEAVCLDIGASTGGFTDCLLQNGAARVYAVDVGYGQLDYRLRQDPRVICMEKTNFRYMKPEQIPEPVRLAVCDVSFISLSLILPPMTALLQENAEAVCLIKPQFEAGREKVGKKGVVRDRKVQAEVVGKVIGLTEENGLSVCGLDYSPIKGPEGNIEFLLYLRKYDGGAASDAGLTEKAAIRKLVDLAHDALSPEDPE